MIPELTPTKNIKHRVQATVGESYHSASIICIVKSFAYFTVCEWMEGQDFRNMTMLYGAQPIKNTSAMQNISLTVLCLLLVRDVEIVRSILP